MLFSSYITAIRSTQRSIYTNENSRRDPVLDYMSKLIKIILGVLDICALYENNVRNLNIHIAGVLATAGYRFGSILTSKSEGLHVARGFLNQ
jgi:hypothetical protein